MIHHTGLGPGEHINCQYEYQAWPGQEAAGGHGGVVGQAEVGEQQAGVHGPVPGAGLDVLLAGLLMLGVRWEACQGSQAGLCQVLGPHHHGHRLEGVVTEPQLPDYAPVVTVVITRAKVLAVQVGLKAAEIEIFIPRL